MESACAGNRPIERTVQSLLIDAARRLYDAGVASARLDAELLLANSLRLSREQLIVSFNLSPDRAQLAAFDTLLKRRLGREPIAYIIGSQEFWSLDFAVCGDVLIPRPETERVIEVALTHAATLASKRCLSIADIGTGSGAIAVALASEWPSARLIASDFSAAALTIAKCNAGTHHVTERIDFLIGDLLTAISDRGEQFDLIVSNPPYIESAVIATLAPEVRDWEPRSALDGGADGLIFYRRIAAEAYKFLAADGVLALEIGADMGDRVSAIFMDTGRYRDVAIHQDHAGRERVITAAKARHS